MNHATQLHDRGYLADCTRCEYPCGGRGQEGLPLAYALKMARVEQKVLRLLPYVVFLVKCNLPGFIGFLIVGQSSPESQEAQRYTGSITTPV